MQTNPTETESPILHPVSAASGLNLRRRTLLGGAAALSVLGCGAAPNSRATAPADEPEAADEAEWDKTFPRSARVAHEKVSFSNRLGIRLVADLYVPHDLASGSRSRALVVGHPYGGVKEQSSGLYAQTMAERGFVTLVFDASYNGESGAGLPHFIASQEAFVEDFQAAVDYLGSRPYVDRESIGVIGVCGSGGFALAAAETDPRIKAVATVSMYDIGQGTRQGLARDFDRAAHRAALARIATARWAEVDGAERAMVVGTPEVITPSSTAIDREFFDYYRTPRGHHPRSTTAMSLTSAPAMSLFSAFDRLDWLSPRPVLFVMGEHAHSRVFSEQAFERAAEPKELLVVPGAGHVDLYDRVNLIPWDRLTSFFEASLGPSDGTAEVAR